MMHGAQEVLAKYDDGCYWYTGCVEPGYDDKEIVAANWNNVPDHVAGYFERHGFELEWSDEWSSCGECGKAVRTQADSYMWTPHYVIENECELVCLECLDADDHLENVKNSTDYLFRLDVSELESRGWSQYNGEYESGWYGTDDSPSDIVAKLPDGLDYVFANISSEQFRINFNLYTKPAESE